MRSLALSDDDLPVLIIKAAHTLKLSDGELELAHCDICGRIKLDGGYLPVNIG